MGRCEEDFILLGRRPALTPPTGTAGGRREEGAKRRRLPRLSGRPPLRGPGLLDSNPRPVCGKTHRKGVIDKGTEEPG